MSKHLNYGRECLLKSKEFLHRKYCQKILADKQVGRNLSEDVKRFEIKQKQADFLKQYHLKTE